MPVVSFPRRLADLVAADPDRPAVTCGDDRVSRRELEARADRLARRLRRQGVTAGDMVTIALPNGVDWIVAVVATWKLGAVPQPVSPKLPERELAAIVELARPAAVLGLERDGDDGNDSGDGEDGDDGRGPLPDVTSPSWKAPTSGGSTGRPKLIVAGEPAEMDTDERPPLRLQPDGCLVMPGPLYHNGPIVWTLRALLWGAHVVVLPRFDAAGTLAAVSRHRADTLYVVPTMMKRISRLPADERDRHDLSSLRTVWHLAEPCPPWLKEEWIAWLGADVIMELYAGTEAQVATVISGREWLEHRGSVGRPRPGEVTILDTGGEPVPAGTVGEIWLRAPDERPTYRYIGARARARAGGWESLGDLGKLDDDGYLYLADRMQDMILSGGANIYPAEVEAAIVEHPEVRSCAVIGLPDDDLGQRAHAVVEADDGAVDADELRTFVRERLVAYKVPRTWEVVQHSIRDEAGKVRRGELRAARLPAAADQAPR